MRRRVLGCLLAAALLAGALPVTPTGAAPSEPSPSPATPSAGTARGGTGLRTVTLITGDRVTVTADGTRKVSIQPGKGREKVGFATQKVGGHLRVIPNDAQALVRDGKVDARLFDITTLVGFGYDDRRGDLPLIVTYAGTAKTRAAASVAAAGARVTREVPGAKALAVKAKRGEAAALWTGLTRAGGGGTRAAARRMAPDVDRLWLDGLRRPSLDASVPQVGAPAAWRAGYTGKAVPVAVLDTGIDATHPDLAGTVVEARNFVEGEDGLDRVGHGTHVASTIAGSGAAAQGAHRGVAPGAKLYDAKVCVMGGCPDSAILAGMHWAAAEKRAKVVNMSLGWRDTPGLDPLEEAVNTLTAKYGTLFVVAAGNDGEGGDYTVSSPGSADAALTVGAVDKTDRPADFSSRGPRVGDHAVKPDLTAPGVAITAARGKDAAAGEPGQRYTTMSGTSMATPHVAGAAAILAQQHPDWTPAQLKAALTGAATPLSGVGVYTQGAGRLDVARAVTQPVTASPPGLGFGEQRWPHSDDKPLTKSVTYHNHGTTATTLQLAVAATGPNGKPAPAGMFTVKPGRVDLPAGGTATVTVTVDTRLGADGFSGGHLTATGGTVAVRTPVAVVREVESYDVTVTTLDRAGKPAEESLASLVSLDKPIRYDVHDPSGTATIRLTKGRYVAMAEFYVVDAPRPETVALVQPLLEVDRDQTLVMDGRLAKPVSVTVPRASAAPVNTFAGFETGHAGAEFFSPGGDLYTAQIGGDRTVDGLVSWVGSHWGEPGQDGTFANSPYAYMLSWFERGRMMTGLHRSVAQSDLATVHADLATATPGTLVVKGAVSRLPGGPVSGGTAGLPYDNAPTSRTEYYNTDGGIQWQSYLHEDMIEEDGGERWLVPMASTYGHWSTYQAGRRYREEWNRGVFGPAFPTPDGPRDFVTRNGDRIHVNLPLHSDRTGRAGYTGRRYDSTRTTLFRNGVKIGETTSGDPGLDQFTVPAGEATYRLEVDIARGAPYALSTRTTVAWTFKSKHVDGDKWVAQPLSAVRFTPKLDNRNKAVGGRSVDIPIEVQRQPGAASARVTKLTVEVSYDDGRTWRKVTVARQGSRAVAHLKHPKGGGFASLRAQSTDSAGNTVEQTIIRAYQF